MLKNSFVTPLDSLRDPTTEQVDELGSIRVIGNKVYKYVALRTAAQTADVNADLGDICDYDAAGYVDHTVVFDYTDGAGIGAGVVQATVDASASADYRFWVQIAGYSVLDGDMASLTLGNRLTIKDAADGTVVACNADTEYSCGSLVSVANDAIVCTFPW